MKPIVQLCALLILTLYTSTSYARLFLDVSVLNKKGIDIGLTLGSELHSREEVRPKEDISLAMKSGVSVLLRAAFDDRVESGAAVISEADKVEKPEKVEEAKEIKKEATPQVSSVIGPSSKVIIRGRVIGVDGQIVKDFFDEPLVVSLGETAIVTYSKDSQLVELKIKPHIK